MTQLVIKAHVAMATLLVSEPTGAKVLFVTNDGEIVGEVFFADGVRPLKDLVPMVPTNGGIQVEGGYLYAPNGRQLAQDHPLARDTGANPDFKPRSMYDETLRAEKLLRDLAQRDNALRKREASILGAVSKLEEAQAREAAIAKEKADAEAAAAAAAEASAEAEAAAE